MKLRIYFLILTSNDNILMVQEIEMLFCNVDLFLYKVRKILSSSLFFKNNRMLLFFEDEINKLLISIPFSSKLPPSVTKQKLGFCCPPSPISKF